VVHHPSELLESSADLVREHLESSFLERAITMAATLKARLRDLLIGSNVWNLSQGIRGSHQLSAWKKAGRPLPPPHVVKQRVLSSYASTFETPVLIETGTYYGHMVYAMRSNFQKIISIELSHELTKKAAHRFRAYPHIQILQGDSGEVLPRILDDISTRSLFWLDGHYSGGITAKAQIDTPVMQELRTIFDHKIKDHVILIDDARCFNGTQDYPVLDELREMVAINRPSYEFSVSNDVIRIHPKRAIESEL
jgi:hypothetical protein